MANTDKYLPSYGDRYLIVQTQIEETQKIIYRTELEKRENKMRGMHDQIEADEFNIKNLKKKLDLLFEVQEELKNEEE